MLKKQTKKQTKEHSGSTHWRMCLFVPSLVKIMSFFFLRASKKGELLYTKKVVQTTLE